MDWKLADAKNKLSEVLDWADREGPQIIMRKGREYAVLPGKQLRELTGHRPDFLTYLMEGPSFEGLELPARDMTPPREIELGSAKRCRIPYSRK